MTTAGTGARRPRADKQRNRAHILEVAEEFFTEQGVDGSLDAIARRAGIGPGTLYRHFPTREALLAGLLEARNSDLEARRHVLLSDEPDPGTALDRWLEALTDWATAFDGLPDPLRAALSEQASPLALACEGFVTVTDDFLAAAQRGGQAEPWVRGRELFLGVLAAAWVRGATLADEHSSTALHAMLRRGWATRPGAADRPNGPTPT